jgi:serine/threonine protein kinase
MEISVQHICNVLARSQLLTADEVRALYQRWRGEAESAPGDANRFRRWLVEKEYVTEFQAERLFQGKTDRYFLNQYKLLDRIGQGRMAGVYKAMHRLGQLVAIKVLPPSKAKDHEAFARFQREARLAKRLNHPNVVRTFQTAVADELYYLVMEHLEGEPLKDVLQRRHHLPPAEAVRLLHQAFQGLQHLYEQNVVHRDLEPGNLMLVPAPQPGQPDNTLHATVKILDIGLGRQIFDESVPAAGGLALTVEGSLLGTPDYMAPEQAKDSHMADIRADIYSLGCVLYHCLTGQPPFQDKQPFRAIIRHATENPAPMKQLNPQVPDGLQKIVDRMLAKDPAQRYQTPLEAAKALELFLARGGEAQSHQAEPRMEAYLQWLATNARDEEGADEPKPFAPTPTPLPAGSVPMVGASARANRELAPVDPALLSSAAAQGSSAWRWFLLLIGILGLGAAGVVGWLLARVVFG